MAKPNAFDIPGLYYFQSRNIFTGSRQDFNFRIEPGDVMKVTVWQGFLCSELAEAEHTAEFPISAEGHAEMLAWLEERFQNK
ncbi:MAG: hypothetical protein IJN57_07565 [Oscillospiraceae bacterium]|nr:hypothetical protein [Oscillospiraceae bacterium]